MASSVRFELLRKEDLPACLALERAAFPADEAASEGALQMRLEEAPAFFLGCYTEKKKLIGYICGTLTAETTLSHSTMYTHNPLGSTLCVHSVVVEKESQRQGIATAMMRHYVKKMVTDHLEIRRIVLVSKAHLIPFYVNCGFQLDGESSLVHGKDPWYELWYDCFVNRFVKIYQVDSFTDQIFKGNPAAVVVCLKPGDLLIADEEDEGMMQRIALEMNLSETAYVKRKKEGVDNIFYLRWFTPAAEVALCGHATLAAAHVLYNEGFVDKDKTIEFHTKRSGVLKAWLTTSYSDTPWICLDFPGATPKKLTGEVASSLQIEKALNIEAKDVLFLGEDRTSIFVEITDEAFKRLRPDSSLIRAMPFRGLTVTCEGKYLEKYDFASRYFAPQVGVEEDPVTGSAHCALCHYWAAKREKTQLLGLQSSSRSGEVLVNLQKDGRVFISGPTVKALEATMPITPKFYVS